jgi:hypothetical protein
MALVVKGYGEIRKVEPLGFSNEFLEGSCSMA